MNPPGKRPPPTQRGYEREQRPQAGHPGNREAPPPQGRPRPKRPPLGARIVRFLLKILLRLGIRAVVLCAAALVAMTLYYTLSMPDSDSLMSRRSESSITLLDRNGRLFGWHGSQFGDIIAADEVSSHLKNAIIATEDRGFNSHFGISPRGILGAIRINILEGRGPLTGHGGSTITQQVAKLLCYGRLRNPGGSQTKAEFEADCRRTTIWRKLLEVPFALALEIKFTKSEILQIYLNLAYLGAGTTGFESASQKYFSKPAARLRPAEAAMLAGLLTAPSYYAPTNNLERARDRARLVVALMERQGYLTAAEAQDARENPAILAPSAKKQAGGYFAEWVVESGPSLLTQNAAGSVTVRTTFDGQIQRAVEEAIQHVFKTKVRPSSKAQVALVALSSDGAVRAMVGGRGARSFGEFNRATQALRQPGSAFKPVVFAAAMDHGSGYRFDTEIDGGPVEIPLPNGEPWRPKNYNDEHYGSVTLTQALAHSINTVAVKLWQDAGEQSVREVAGRLGITSGIAAGPAVALGTSEATLLEMTGVYASILNEGRRTTPYGISEIRAGGESVASFSGPGASSEQAISKGAARQLTHMMHQAIESGTGKKAKLGEIEAAGKTGTTQAARDAWFIGFTADYVMGVWMGYDDNTPLTDVTGGGLPADIWREAMARIHQNILPRPLPMIDPEIAGETLGLPGPPTTEPGVIGDFFRRLFGIER